MTVLERIKKTAKKQKIPMYKVAEEAGISRNNMYKWNKVTPNAESIKKVAKVLNVTTGYLLDGDKDSDSKAKSVDLDDESAVMTFQGKPIPDKYKEIFKDILRGLDDDK